VLLLGFSAFGVLAQTADLKFEVASVKATSGVLPDWRVVVGMLPPTGGRARTIRGEFATPQRDEVAGRDEIRLQAARRIDHAFNAPFPCRVEIDAGDIGKNIEAPRVTSETKETAGVGEVLGVNVWSAAPNSASAAYVACALAASAFMKGQGPS
jgi:hypothetical protein